MKRILLLFLLLNTLPLAAQQFNDDDDDFYEVRDMDGITLSGQASHFAQSDGFTYTSYGVQLNDYFGGGFFVRNRYLYGKDYFKFSTAELSVLLIRSDALSNTEGCREAVGLGIIMYALFILNDGIGYTVPLRYGLYVSPFVSPFELYFTREPGRYFHPKMALSFGAELKKTVDVKGVECVLGVSGEGVYDYVEYGTGYRLNFSLGVPFPCW